MVGRSSIAGTHNIFYWATINHALGLMDRYDNNEGSSGVSYSVEDEGVTDHAHQRCSPENYG